MIRMRGWKGHETEQIIRSFVKWANKALDIEHEIILEREDFLYGIYCPPDRVGDDPGHTIVIVTAMGQGALDVLDTVAHEVAHYFQWREGRALTENGVAEVAARLVREWRGS